MASIVVRRCLDGREQGFVARAAHRDPSSVLYWHLDDEYAGKTQGEHEILLHPGPGRHLLTTMDATGASKAVSFTVK